MHARISKVRTILEKKQLDAIVVSSVSNIFYLTQCTAFSREEREAYVLITRDAQYIFTDGRYTEAVKRSVPNFNLQVIPTQTPFVSLLKNICEKEQLRKIGFEENNITFWEYQRMKENMHSLHPLSLHIRMIKDTNEITKIQTACHLGDRAFTYILSKIKYGITEKALQTEIELFLKKEGADISFRPIVAFGGHASMPHHLSSDQRKLNSNECVLIDMGAKVDGYCSDITRTIFFGKPNDEEKKIYEIVLESQKRAIDYINTTLEKKFLDSAKSDLTPPGTTIKAKEVDAVARDYIISQGYPSIPHSLGHGIGIDVHEPPSLNLTSEVQLQNGMVFSIEPGIYIPNQIGVRIEDLATIENHNLKILTLSPKELICI